MDAVTFRRTSEGIFRDNRTPARPWVIRYRDTDGRIRKERTPDGTSKTVARRLLSERQRQVERATLLGLPTVQDLIAPREVPSLRQFAKEYMTHVEAMLTPATVRRYRSILDAKVLPALGDRTLTALTAGDIQRFADNRATEGAAPASVRQEILVLSAIYREARKREIIPADRNPVALVKKPTVENTVVRFLSADEEKEILARAPEPLRSAIVLAIHTGAREGELVRLTWADVRWEERAIVLRHTKAKKDRVVPLSDTAHETLRAMPRHVTCPHVFVTPDGLPYVRFNNTVWRRILRDAGIRCRWHDLRHTTGSRLAAAGVPAVAIRDLLGHGSLAVTTKYLHLSRADLSAAVRALDRPPEGLDFTSGRSRPRSQSSSLAESYPSIKTQAQAV